MELAGGETGVELAIVELANSGALGVELDIGVDLARLARG